MPFLKKMKKKMKIVRDLMIKGEAQFTTKLAPTFHNGRTKWISLTTRGRIGIQMTHRETMVKVKAKMMGSTETVMTQIPTRGKM